MALRTLRSARHQPLKQRSSLPRALERRPRHQHQGQLKRKGTAAGNLLIGRICQSLRGLDSPDSSRSFVLSFFPADRLTPQTDVFHSTAGAHTNTLHPPPHPHRHLAVDTLNLSRPRTCTCQALAICQIAPSGRWHRATGFDDEPATTFSPAPSHPFHFLSTIRQTPQQNPARNPIQPCTDHPFSTSSRSRIPIALSAPLVRVSSAELCPLPHASGTFADHQRSYRPRPPSELAHPSPRPDSSVSIPSRILFPSVDATTLTPAAACLLVNPSSVTAAIS